MRGPVVLCIALLGVSEPGRARAADVEAARSDLEGVITQVSDPNLVLDDSVAPGLPFTASYFFDPEKAESTHPAYLDPDVSLYTFARGPFGMFVQLGNYPFFSWSLHLRFMNDVFDVVGNDEFLLESGVFDELPPGNPLVQVDGMSIHWRMAMCVHFACPVDFGGTPNPLHSDALLRVVPTVGAWTVNEFRFVGSSGWWCPPAEDYCVPDELFSVDGIVTRAPAASASVQSLLSLFALGLLIRVRRSAAVEATR